MNILSCYVKILLFLASQNVVGHSLIPITLKRLVALEFEVVSSFSSGVASLNEENRSHIQEYLDEYRACVLSDLGFDSFEGAKDMDQSDFDVVQTNVVKHPIKIFKLLKRLFLQLRDVTESLTINLEEILSNFQMKEEFPSFQDVEASMRSLLKINQMYPTEASFANLLHGDIGTFHSQCNLSRNEVIELGKLASLLHFHSQAVEAFYAVHQDIDMATNQNEEEYHSSILHLLQGAIKCHDAWDLNRQDIQADSGPLLYDKALISVDHTNFANRESLKFETIFPPDPLYFDQEGNLPPLVRDVKNAYLFQQLCSGELEQMPVTKLQCHLVKPHPYFHLHPLMVEVYNEDPPIIGYHNVIPVTVMEAYKNEVELRLAMSRILNVNPNTREEEISEEKVMNSKERTSSNSWIGDFYHPRFKKTLEIIGLMLDINVATETATESMQVATYSPGGLYVPHMDVGYAGVRSRIMTFMIYLSDVELGGKTVFPEIGIGVDSKMGSALTWYNLLNDGSVDERMVHGGCPIAMGEKWIANKWVIAEDQMFRRQCHHPSSWNSQDSPQSFDLQTLLKRTT